MGRKDHVKPDTEISFKRLPIMPKGDTEVNWSKTRSTTHHNHKHFIPITHTVDLSDNHTDNTARYHKSQSQTSHDTNILWQLLHHTHITTPLTILIPSQSLSHTHTHTQHRYSTDHHNHTHTLTLHQFLVLRTPTTLQGRTPTRSSPHCHYSTLGLLKGSAPPASRVASAKNVSGPP